MTCKVIENKNGIAFVCSRGRNAELTEDDQRKIDEIIKNLEKRLGARKMIAEYIWHYANFYCL